MSSIGELDYEEEPGDSPATTMWKKDMRGSPQEVDKPIKDQGWSVSQQGVYRCLVPECNEQQYSSTTCIKRHWTAKHTRKLKRYKCCKRECTVVHEQLWKMKKHAKVDHQMDDAQIKKDWFPGFHIQNDKYIDPGNLKGPEQTQKEARART